MAHNFRKNGFTFRQFFIAHDQCGMKVSTDGIILGAVSPLPDNGYVLDIGSGSGLISLMMAQRIHAAGKRPQIEAIEIEAAAVEQSRQNIAASPWPDAVRVHHCDILQWAPQASPRYPIIVSNPPFFSPGVDCSSSARQTARYTTTLTHQALLNTAQQHITNDGLFCVILPVVPATAFISLAQQSGWTLCYCLDVSEYADREAHRRVVVLSLAEGEYYSRRLIIRDASGEYSADYRQLTADFYLSNASKQAN